MSRPVYGSGLGSAPSPRLLLLRAHCETTRGPGTSWPVLEHGVRCEPPHALIGKMELSSAHPDLPTLASLEYSVDTQRHKKNSSGHFIQHNEICIIIYFHAMFSIVYTCKFCRTCCMKMGEQIDVRSNFGISRIYPNASSEDMQHTSILI